MLFTNQSREHRMSKELKQILKKSTFWAIQAGLLTVASLFAYQGLFWPMMMPLSCLASLAYCKNLHQTDAILK